MKQIVPIMLTMVFALNLTGVASAAPSKAKEALILKLMKKTKAAEMAESSTDAILAQMQQGYAQTYRQLVQEANLGEDALLEQKQLLDSQTRFMTRFREEYPRRVDLEDIMRQIYVPLYDKYFNDDELKALLKFYETPAGQKSIDVMPKLFQESMQRFDQLVTPSVLQLVGEILEEEKENLRGIADVS